MRSLEYSISNRADSFYEYLLKGWLLRNKKDKVNLSFLIK